MGTELPTSQTPETQTDSAAEKMLTEFDGWIRDKTSISAEGGQSAQKYEVADLFDAISPVPHALGLNSEGN